MNTDNRVEEAAKELKIILDRTDACKQDIIISDIRKRVRKSLNIIQEWQKQQPLGLRWVKADERLPELKKVVVVKCNHYYNELYWNNDKWFKKGTNHIALDNHYNSEIEWLDESLPAPVEGDGDWIDCPICHKRHPKVYDSAMSCFID